MTTVNRILKKSFTKLSSSKIVSQLSLVIVGNFVAAFFGALAVLIISRKLSVSDFGLFSTALSVILITARLTDIGTTQSMITFASSLLGSGRDEHAEQFLKLSFLIRFAVSLMVALILYFTANALSTKVFRHSDLIPLIKVGAIGIIFLSLFGFLKAVFQTYQLFRISVILQLLSDVSKFLAVCILAFYFKLSSIGAIAIFSFASVVGVIGGFWEVKHKISTEKIQFQRVLKPLFSFSKWMFLNNASNTIIPGVGIFMVARMLDSESAGIYGLAYNLNHIFPILIVSLVSVLLPEVSRFNDIESFASFVRNGLKISLYLIIGASPILLLSGGIIKFFFGVRYAASVPIFNLLFLSSIITVATTFFRIILYPLNKPHIVAIASTISLLVLVAGCYILIPIMGVTSPAILLLGISILNYIFLYFYVYKRIQDGRVEFKDTQLMTFESF